MKNKIDSIFGVQKSEPVTDETIYKAQLIENEEMNKQLNDLFINDIDRLSSVVMYVKTHFKEKKDEVEYIW